MAGEEREEMILFTEDEYGKIIEYKGASPEEAVAFYYDSLHAPQFRMTKEEATAKMEGLIEKEKK